MPDAIYAFLTAVGYPHPLHPILTHITIGSVIGAVLFAVVGWIWRRPVLWTTARHAIVLAFISAFFTAGMGLVDWQHFYAGAPLTAITVKIIASAVLVVLLLATILVTRRLPAGSKLPLLFYLLAFANVIVLGFFGGNLVYGSG